MFTSTEHSEWHLPPPAHLPAVCRRVTRGLGSDWTKQNAAKSSRMMKADDGGSCKEEGKGEICTTGLKYFHFSTAWQRYFWVEGGGTRMMGNTQTTVNCCSTINKLHSIRLWLISITFYQLVQSEHYKLFSTLLHLLLLSRHNCQVRIYLAQAAHARDSGGHVLEKVWPWTFSSF